MTCGHTDEPGPFCRECGTRLTWQCPDCRITGLPFPTAKFCQGCGKPRPSWLQR